MKTTQIILTALLLFSATLLFTPQSQAQTCDSTNCNFIDLNGDGFNDNAPDDDGDGIPNGLDPDYIKHAKDGTGQQKGKLQQTRYAQDSKSMNKLQKKNRLGKSNSSQFQNRKNLKGSGSQAASVGNGVCDGTGPRGGSSVCDGTGPRGPRSRGSK